MHGCEASRPAMLVRSALDNRGIWPRLMHCVGRAGRIVHASVVEEFLEENGPGRLSPGSRRTRTCAASHSHEHRKTHPWRTTRSEEHTSELQSRENLVCRLLLE